MNDRLTGLIGAIFTSFVIGVIVGYALHDCPKEAHLSHTSQSIRIDTITKVVEHEPIFVESKARVIYRRDTVTQREVFTQHDTVIQTRPFVAALDTIVHRDTIGVRYLFPEHTFSVAIRQAPDSVKYETRTITLTAYEQRPWWIDALTQVGAVAVGFGAGRLTP